MSKTVQPEYFCDGVLDFMLLCEFSLLVLFSQETVSASLVLLEICDLHVGLIRSMSLYASAGLRSNDPSSSHGVAS
jgi:hypothetical protein